jgi:hypothetical protein
MEQLNRTRHYSQRPQIVNAPCYRIENRDRIRRWNRTGESGHEENDSAEIEGTIETRKDAEPRDPKTE